MADLCLEFALLKDIFHETAVTRTMNTHSSWEPLGNHVLKHQIKMCAGAPGFCVDNFTVWLKDLGFADCFEVNVTAHGRLYGIRFEDASLKKFQNPGIFVRQVPTPLVFNCELSIVANEKYKAVFHTLAGTPIMHLEEDLPPMLLVHHLVEHMRETAEAMDLSQSANQQVRLLINGAVEEQDPAEVLWYKFDADEQGVAAALLRLEALLNGTLNPASD